MYKKIYIPVDNSEYSTAGIDISISIARVFGAKCIGSHVYAARLHDLRFKQMESGLPPKYIEEEELEKQRDVHDSLITKGLKIITDSYLDVFEKKCKQAGVIFERRALEGRNFKVLAEDIKKTESDLVVMGALGVGAVEDSVIGSVCERVVRRTNKDILVVKNTNNINKKKIIVGIDGSPMSYGGIKTAMALAQIFGSEIEAVSVFDPFFHYAVFNNIVGVLSEDAGKLFKFKEQEKLHEEVIDSGLAKIYQSHLGISQKIALDENLHIKTHLFDGKVFDKLLQYVKKEEPWLLIVGRAGIHSDGNDMEIGSNTENLLRMVSSNILICNRTFVPSIEATAEETIVWTEEAIKNMEKIPAFARGMARGAINRYAVDKGYTVISSSVIDSAIETILPQSMRESMGIKTTSTADKKNKV
ncbi:MAG: universal stress protein [Nitrospirota bacterium]